MTVEEFIRLLATHGPDIATWPAPARRPATRLRDGDPEALAAWENALRRWAPLAGDGLAAGHPGALRVQAGIDASLRRIRHQQRASTRPGWGWLVWRPAGAVFATMAVAGWLAGTWLSPPPDSTAPVSLATLFTLTGVGGDWLVQ
ncbi:hypothetical protein [Azospirillum sp. B4]|uniref:hypothetical protein n=1 Tax=Azospirillum sp. B4 TaxID=95605 RepID=UPI0003462A36|nr:hypothetical protein [Azospirillum sp. B4]